MKKKWPNIKYNLVALLLILSSCTAPVKEDVQYKYSFKQDTPIQYDFKMDLDTTMEAVIFHYNGKITMTADVELDLVRTDTLYGNKVRMLMKNLDVKAADPRIKAALMMGMNYFRTYFANLFFTDTGKLTVLYFEKPQPEFGRYASMLFPEFSDMNMLWKGSTLSTNMELSLNGQKVLIILEQEQAPAHLKDNILKIYRQHIIRIYDAKDYKQSVESEPLITVKMDMDILFDTVRQQIYREDIDVDMTLSYVIKQGIMVQRISGSAIGKVSIARKEEQNL